MGNKLRKYNTYQKIGLLLMLVSFIGVCFGIRNTNNWFWISIALNMFGVVKYADVWADEGKTWFKKLDKNYNKNLTRRPSERIVFLMVAYTICICSFFIAEFFFVDLTEQLWVMAVCFVLTVIMTIIISTIVDKTQKEVDVLSSDVEEKMKGRKRNGKKKSFI